MPETEPTCRICRARPERVRRFHVKGKEEIFLYRCGNCGSEMLLPQPSDALIRAQYRDYYCRRTLLTDAPFPKQAFFNELISGNMELFPAKRFRAVELGAGAGDFVKAFNSAFPEASITAVEMNREAEDNYSTLRCDLRPMPIEEFLDGCSEKYDCVFMFDVLEHLKDPAGVLGRVASLLAPGGKVFITAPVVNTLLHSVLKSHWPQYKVEHLFYFSKEAYGIMGQGLGLDLIKCSGLSKRLPLSYLLSVGANFGPEIFSKAVSLATRFLPKRLYSLRVRLPLSELLVVYGKRPGR